MTFSEDIKTVYASPTLQAAICHDALREHMQAGVRATRPSQAWGAPKQGRQLSPGTLASIEVRQAKAAAKRAEYRPRILELRALGYGYNRIGKEIGKSNEFVERVLFEAGA